MSTQPWCERLFNSQGSMYILKRHLSLHLEKELILLWIPICCHWHKMYCFGDYSWLWTKIPVMQLYSISGFLPSSFWQFLLPYSTEQFLASIRLTNKNGAYSTYIPIYKFFSVVSWWRTKPPLTRLYSIPGFLCLLLLLSFISVVAIVSSSTILSASAEQFLASSAAYLKVS